jgi:hypothetical protein
MLLGLAELARRWHIGPRSGQTVLSQIMADAVGRHWAYYLVSLTITLVLALAANTSFGGLPVLASLLARDNFLPHLFGLRGERQTFANGIWATAIMAAVLLVAVGGNTIALIPLYAIGVFTGFTLSQSGLVVHWWRTRPARWQYRAALNALGAAVTGVATAVFLLTKFTEGAWVVVIAVPSFILLFTRIRRYYDRVGRELALGERPARPAEKHTVVIVPVSGVSRLAQFAVSEALSIGQEVIAVTVVFDDDDGATPGAAELRERWAAWNCGVRLEILHTEYSYVAEPIVAFIDQIRAERDVQVMVLIPAVVPDQLRYLFLHNHMDAVLSAALRNRPGVIVARTAMPLSTDG